MALKRLSWELAKRRLDSSANLTYYTKGTNDTVVAIIVNITPGRLIIRTQLVFLHVLQSSAKFIFAVVKHLVPEVRNAFVFFLGS